MHATDGPDNVKSARRIPARPHQMLLNGWMFTTQEIRSKTTRVSKPDSGKHRYKKDSDLDNTSWTRRGFGVMEGLDSKKQEPPVEEELILNLNGETNPSVSV